MSAKLLKFSIIIFSYKMRFSVLEIICSTLIFKLHRILKQNVVERDIKYNSLTRVDRLEIINSLYVDYIQLLGFYYYLWAHHTGSLKNGCRGQGHGW